MIRHFAPWFCFALICFQLQPTCSPYASLPPEMLGTWTSSEVRSTTFRDAVGGYSRPSGAVVRYSFSSDGRYKEDTLLETSMYNCTDSVFATEAGNVVISGSGVVFKSSGGTLKSTDNCNARFNYSKVLPPRDYVYSSWGLRNAPSGTELCLVKDGKTLCYRRGN